MKLATMPPPSHAPVLQKATAFVDQRSPSGPIGLQRRTGTGHTLDNMARNMVISRLMRTRLKDPDVFAGMDRIRSRVPESRIVESPGNEGTGDETVKAEIESVFHRPDGAHSYRQILAVTADRLKCIGAAHWLFRRAGDMREGLSKRIDQFARVLHEGGIPASALPLLSKALDDAVSGSLASASAGDVVGFEWLQGYVARDTEDKARFVQVVGGSTPNKKYWPAENIVEFIRMNPHDGGPLSALEAVEEQSDASLWAFMLNRDAARTGGMADLMLAIEGMSEAERDRLMALMYQRANPSQTDLSWIPIVIRLTSTFQGRAPVVHDVSLSKKDRDAQWLEWDKGIDKRKFGILGTPAPLVKEWQTMNRSATETLNQTFFDYTWWPLFEDINEPINDRLIVEEMGSDQWCHEFVKPDFRSTDERHKQETTNLENGLVTPYAQFVDENGQLEADRVYDELKKRGLDADSWKMPWLKQGKGWLPLTSVVPPEGGVAADFDPLAAAMRAEGAPLPDENGEDDDDDGNPFEEKPAVEKSLQVLDSWQSVAADAVRHNLDPTTAWPANDSVADIPEELMVAVDEALEKATTVQDVSDAFAPARAELRKGLAE